MTITQAYILCGGLGTRLGSLTKDTPKPMLPVGGKPILQHIVEHLKKHGITRIVLAAGYKAEVVEQFFSELDFGIDVHVFTEPDLVGTAGSMPLLKDKLDENFLMVYGDVFLDFDVSAMLKTHEDSQALATFLLRPSSHPWDSNLIQVDKEKRVTAFLGKEKEPGYQNWGDCAVYVLNKNIVKHIPSGKSDFMKQVFPAALTAGEKLVGHELESSGFVRDMGKPERFPIVEAYLSDREAIAHARENPKPISCVFLDRDGVLNEEVNLLARPDQLQLLPGVPQAIKLFNDAGIKTVVVTNQPVLARGVTTQSTLDLIHNKLRRLIETEGGEIDALYFCPHHPETQYNEGVQELRRGCDCRKPRNGMLLQARRDLGLDLASCIMIGDSFRDIEAGKNSGIRTIMIDSGKGAQKEGIVADHTYPSLLDAAKEIVAGRLNT